MGNMKKLRLNQLSLSIKAVLFNCSLLLAAPGVAMAIPQDAQNSSSQAEEDIEVIQVSYGYSSLDKSDLTGAISSIDMEELIDLPAGNIMQNLQGRVPGLQITTNGNPSSTATVRIRGQGLGPLGNNDPLYIIDGIPTKSGMHELNSNDISDVQVLRDAAAASIYGARSGNGVIVITTKKGGEDFNIDFRFNQSFQDFSYDLNPLTTAERGQAVWRGAINDRRNPDSVSPLYSYDWNGDFDSPQLNSVILPTFTDADQVQRPADTNWFDEVTRSSTTTDMNLSISGSSDTSRYFTSLGSFKAEGIVDGSEFERLSFRVNSDHDVIKDKVKVGQNFTITNQRENLVNSLAGNILGLSIEQQSIVPVHNDEGGWGGPVSGITDRDNPVRLIEMNKDNVNRYNKMMANFYVEYTPIEDLVLRSNYGIDYGQMHFRNFTRAFKAGNLSFGDLLTVDENWNRSLVWSNTAEYKLTLDEDHKFTFLVGTENIEFDSEYSVGYGSGFASADRDFAFLSQATDDVRVAGGGDSWKLNSYFGRVDYNFDKRYLAGATLRRDGSSRFGENHEYGNFPAASVGWIVTNEDFFKVDFISSLKLRASWGETGNQEISTSATRTTYQPRYATQSLFTDQQDEGTAYDITGANTGTLPSGFTRAQTGNPDLKWETSTQTNIGVDFSVYYGTVYGSFDYFEKETKDILTMTQPIATLGEGALMLVNGGTIENVGFEFILGYDDYVNFDFLADELKFDVSFNISKADNEVIYLPTDVVNSFGGNGQDKTIVGHSINSAFGYVAEGLFQSQAEVDAHAIQAGAGPGRIRWADLNNDGVIDEQDQEFFASSDPDYIYGMNFTVNYGNWDLNMFWQGVEGGKVRNNWRMFTDFTSLNIGSNYGDRVLSAWTPENSNSDVPALTLIDNNGEGRQSSFFYEDASYLKLRNLSVGYSPDESFLNDYGIKSGRIFLQGSNLLTITPDGTLSQDPETPNEVFPIARSFTLGVDVSF
ncbi:MAG: TonB-linked SusC/RagA family outer membrane protein [Paraglaciecola sp.]|jgi:TonB-linked SusC/RagA family outer membrane protein